MKTYLPEDSIAALRKLAEEHGAGVCVVRIYDGELNEDVPFEEAAKYFWDAVSKPAKWS